MAGQTKDRKVHINIIFPNTTFREDGEMETEITLTVLKG